MMNASFFLLHQWMCSFFLFLSAEISCKIILLTSVLLICRKNESGPPHSKKFICTVQIATVDGVYTMEGEERSRVKDAENCAASLLCRALHEYNYL